MEVGGGDYQGGVVGVGVDGAVFRCCPDVIDVEEEEGGGES